MFFHQQTFRWQKVAVFPCQSEALRATFGICRRGGDNITHSLNAEGVPGYASDLRFQQSG